MDRQADDLRVLLQSRVDDHLRRLTQAGVDHLVAGVPQGAGDDLDASVVTVQADLGEHDPDRPDGRLRRHQMTAFSVYRPNTSTIVFMISPSVAYARTASRIYGIRLSLPAAAFLNRARAVDQRAGSRLARTSRTRATCSLSSLGSMRRISIGSSSSTVNSLTPTTTLRFCSSSCWYRNAASAISF